MSIHISVAIACVKKRKREEWEEEVRGEMGVCILDGSMIPVGNDIPPPLPPTEGCM